jgi:tetratricopeptide (TPR) repeat protein
LKIRELALGPDHTDVAESLLGMASLYADAGRRDEAAAHLERALTIRQGTLGPDHPEMAKMRNALLELRDRQHVR